MPRLLLLLPTTTYRTQAFLAAARRLGVEVTVASEEASSLTLLNPRGLLRLDFSDPDRAARDAAKFAAKYPIDAVVPVDDQVTEAAAVICRTLSLRHNSVESVMAARLKHRMRELLERAGVPSPRYRLSSLDEDPVHLARQVDYPCVVKPLALAGSRGVMRANNEAEFVQFVGRLEKILEAEAAERSAASNQETRGQSPPRDRPETPPLASQDLPRRSREGPRQFLVEDFIPGSEVALEGLLRRGELSVLALFDKPDPLDGPFFEETLYVTPSRFPASVQAQIANCSAQATRALGLVEGPVHVELRVNDAGPWVIEINARSIGGLCSRVLRFGVGISLEELIIRHALEAEFSAPERERQPAGVMMIPIPCAGLLREVRGLVEAKAVSGIQEVTLTARPGEELVPLPEGSRYLGFIFAQAASPEAVEAALRAAHARLEFVIK